MMVGVSGIWPLLFTEGKMGNKFGAVIGLGAGWSEELEVRHVLLFVLKLSICIFGKRATVCHRE